MKIAIGTKIQSGPWGGGNQFAVNLTKYLEKEGHFVTNNLTNKNLDVILLTEPRKTSETSTFNHKDIIKYKKYINNDVTVFHRINECDERKNTNYMNKFIIEANKSSDVTIFVSSWLKNLYLKLGIKKENLHVIMAGADGEVFNNQNFQPWIEDQKIKLVTHHWGTNHNKGYEIYQYIDKLLNNPLWKEKIEFTFIGNLPSNISLNNTKLTAPQSGKKLAESLKLNNLYITGSLFEPSGNHHIEAAQCGLPIFYINSGGTTEYCKDYGIEYSLKNIEEKISYFMKNNKTYYEKVADYPYNSDLMCKDFLNLFEKYTQKREKNSSKKRMINNNFLLTIYYSFKFKVISS
tara:strand:+ start:907 stop:1950 length:1044 start_codon:yes stop_codon:yes gene_type:complete